MGQNEVKLTIFKTRERHEIRFVVSSYKEKNEFNDIDEIHIVADSDHKRDFSRLNNPRSQRRSRYTWIVQKAKEVISAAIMSSKRLSPKSAFGEKLSVKVA